MACMHYSWQRILSKSVAVKARLRLLATDALLRLSPDNKSSGTITSEEAEGVGDGHLLLLLLELFIAGLVGMMNSLFDVM